jgi:DNA topoisomerase-1
MEKMEDKINGLRFQQWRVKQMILDIDPKQKKKRGAEYFERPEDLTDEWVKEHVKSEVEKKRDAIQKKFAKENEKLVAEGKKEMKSKDLEARLEEADELEKKYKKEIKSGKVAAEGKGASVEKMDGNLEKLEARIETMKVQKDDKDNNKEVALGTSKIVSSSTGCALCLWRWLTCTPELH